VSTLLTTTTDEQNVLEGTLSPEAEVQDLLARLAQLSSEARKLFISRLLLGVAERVTSEVSTNAVKTAQIQSVQSDAKSSARPDPYKNPAFWPGVGLMELEDEYDPIEGWQHFGRDAYYRIIYHETQTTLEHILAHRNMPKGVAPRKNATGAAMAKAIIHRLEKFHKYQP
jgi:hypothetical protein